jgi:molybdenum cofactor cytidylyltransferase
VKFGPVPLEQAVGEILAHTILGTDGHKLLNKGHVLTPADLDTLAALQYEMITVAALDSTDVGENEAAKRVGAALTGPGIRFQAPGVGRANLLSTVTGPLRINVAALNQINAIDEGITIATLREHSSVHEGQLVALVKIIPFGVAESAVADVEATAREYAPILTVRALRTCSAALIVSGPESARARLLPAFAEPTRTRLERLGSRLDAVCYVPHETAEIASALTGQRRAGCDLVILAGVSAIMDRDDVTPQALRAAGGTVSHFGVPVDPGSLLMLGYVDSMPVIGAPGCAKSLQTNVIDWILPRLLAGERLTRADLILMGHGGLLDDISERPMPRRNTEDDV